MMRIWLLIALLGASGLTVAEIYRWTDEQGLVHYGERPPGDSAQQLDIDIGASPAPTVQPDEAARRDRRNRLLEAYAYERERKAEQAAQQAHKANQLAVQCDRLRDQWRRLNYAGPIYFQNEDGERRYLDEDQRAAELDQLRPAFRQACGTAPE